MFTHYVEHKCHSKPACVNSLHFCLFIVSDVLTLLFFIKAHTLYLFTQAFMHSAPPLSNRSGELRMQNLKSHLLRTQSLNVLPLKPGVGQYVAIHATPTARNFFLISTLPVHSPAFSKTSPDFSLRWL